MKLFKTKEQYMFLIVNLVAFYFSSSLVSISLHQYHSWPLHPKEFEGNSLLSLPYISNNVWSENLVLNQFTVPYLILFFVLITSSAWYGMDIARRNYVLVTWEYFTDHSWKRWKPTVLKRLNFTTINYFPVNYQFNVISVTSFDKFYCVSLTSQERCETKMLYNSFKMKKTAERRNLTAF